MIEYSTIHASAVLVGAKAVLIRGPAGSGKSHLVWELLQLAAKGALPFARLVADDRAYAEISAGRYHSMAVTGACTGSFRPLRSNSERRCACSLRRALLVGLWRERPAGAQLSGQRVLPAHR